MVSEELSERDSAVCYRRCILGADPGFQVRGGGGGANLKKNAPSGGRGVRPPLHVIYNLRMITLFQHKDDKLELLPV